MGTYGSTLGVTLSNKNDFNLSNFSYDTGVQSMYSGID